MPVYPGELLPVCHKWFPIAQKYLVEEAVLTSDNHLKQLVLLKSTSSEPIKSDVKEFKIYSVTEQHERPFHHLVPCYTAKRFIASGDTEDLGAWKG